MKKYKSRHLLIIIAVISANSHSIIFTHDQTGASIQSKDLLISANDYAFMVENPSLIYAYIPHYIRSVIQQLHKEYSHFNEHIDDLLFSIHERSIVPHSTAIQLITALLEFLGNASTHSYHLNDNILRLLQDYIRDLQSGTMHISLESASHHGTRAAKIIQSDNGLIILAAAKALALLGGTNSNTVASGSTVTFNMNSSPSFSGALAVSGSITTSGSINATGTITASKGFIASTGGLVVGGGGITDVGPTTFNSLSNGIMSASATGLVSSTPTVNHAVQVGNTGGTLTSLPVATNGQILMSATGLPSFTGLSAIDSSIRYSSGAGFLTLQSTPLFGNTLRVDAVFGNDATAVRTGFPFSTVGAALTAAQAGDTVWIFPGTYTGPIVIGAGINLQGLDQNTVNINQTAVTSATDLVTMGTNSSINNLSLSLTSSANVQLRGIVLPSSTATGAMIDNVNLTVTSATGNQKIYGIHSPGTGVAPLVIPSVHASSIAVNTTGVQTTRGIILDTNANTLNISDSTIAVSNTGSAGSAIGVETAIAGAVCNLDHCTISGFSTAGIGADISQTNGTINLAATKLVNSDANSLEFNNTLSPSIYTWGGRSVTIPLSSTPQQLVPGGGSSTITGGTTANISTQVNLPQATVIKTLSAYSSTAPTAGNTMTFVLRLNGTSNTPLLVTIPSGSNSAVSSNLSATCPTGSFITLQTFTSTAAVAADNVLVTAELY